MSEANKTKLQSLTKRQLDILNFIVEDKDVNITDISKKLDFAESTVRNELTRIYEKLEIPGRPQEKRDNLYRDYADDYRELYLKVGETTSIPETNIHINPPTPRPNPNRVLLIVISSFLLVSFVVIAILIGVIRALNTSRVAAIRETSTAITIIESTLKSNQEIIGSTQTVMAYTPTLTLTPTITSTITPIPPTPTITLTPTITNTPEPTSIPIYTQGSGWNYKSGMSITLLPNFLNSNSVRSCSGDSTNIGLSLQINNDTQNDFRVVFDTSKITAVDDLGNTYKPVCVNIGIQRVNGLVDEVFTYLQNDNGSAIYPVFPKPDPKAKYLDIIFEEISGVKFVTFRKELY